MEDLFPLIREDVALSLPHFNAVKIMLLLVVDLTEHI